MVILIKENAVRNAEKIGSCAVKKTKGCPGFFGVG